MTTPLTQWIGLHLGEHEVVSVPHQTSHKSVRGDVVLEVRDSAGTRWYAKRVADRDQWQAEVRAYRHWTPALGDHAARLRAADPGSQSILLSAVPGAPPDRSTAAQHREAGRLLRRLHDAHPARPRAGRVTVWSRRVEDAAQEHPRWFTPAERDHILEVGRRIEDIEVPDNVPCHGDYCPRNWLVDEHGTLRVIDFGSALWSPRAFELTALLYGEWWRRPELASPFLEGYDWRATDDELELMRLRLHVRAFLEAAFGRRHGIRWKARRGRRRLGLMMAGIYCRDRGTDEPCLIA